MVAGGLAAAPLLDHGVATDSLPASPRPTVTPQFQILWQHNEVVLAGHTATEQHERDLVGVAASQFPDSQLSTDFKPLGVVPDYWAEVSVGMLYLLAATRSAEASLVPTGISIRGIVDNEPGWQSRLAAYRSTLPGEFRVSTDTLFVNSVASVAEICARAISNYAPGRIEFEESGTALRSSAYPRLDRVIALARTCQRTRILITGHTDASGTAALNDRLSLERAAGVAEYIANSGIDPVRLTVSGAGSRQPIADDGTRHGRSLNRRIEIAFELL